MVDLLRRAIAPAVAFEEHWVGPNQRGSHANQGRDWALLRGEGRTEPYPNQCPTCETPRVFHRLHPSHVYKESSARYVVAFLNAQGTVVPF